MREVMARLGRLFHVEMGEFLHLFQFCEIHGPESVPCGEFDRIGARAHRLEHGWIRLLIGFGHDAHPPHPIVVADLADSAGVPGALPGRVVDAVLVGIGNLVVIPLHFHRIFLPEFKQHFDAFLEDVAVLHVVGPAEGVGDGGLGVAELPQDVRPPGLITARQATEELPLGDVVENRRLLGHANRILSRHDVSKSAHPRILDMIGPPSVENARIGAYLITFRVQVVLDSADAPYAHLIGGLHDVDPFVKHVMVQILVPGQGPFLLALLPAFRRQHGV